MAQRGILGTVAVRRYAVRAEVSQTGKGKWPKMNPTTGEPCCLCTSKLLAMVPGRLEEDKGQPDEKAIGEVLPITHGTSKLLAMVPDHLEKATRQSNQKAIGKPLPITHGPVRVRRPTLSAHWTAQRKARRRVDGWRIALKTIIMDPMQMVPDSIRRHELTPDRSPRSHWGEHGGRHTAWLSLERREPSGEQESPTTTWAPHVDESKTNMRERLVQWVMEIGTTRWKTLVRCQIGQRVTT